MNRIGIRLEDKNEWEKRVPLSPSDVANLVGKGIDIRVQSFERRVFEDKLYKEAGATLANDVWGCDLVLGIKEMPTRYFRAGGAYMFFSHTIKGQPHNMEMLARLADLNCTLLDYETVTDQNGRRLILFGRYAGLAGMIDTLWTLGRRLEALGHKTPFLDIRQALSYSDVEEAKKTVVDAGKRFAKQRLPGELAPLVVGFAGYGNVSSGAQEIFDLLPHVQVEPNDLRRFVSENKSVTDRIVKVVFKEEHMVERADKSKPFNLDEYYKHPELYRSIFDQYLGLMTVLVNGIVWTERYPRLADAGQLKRLFAASEKPKLMTVGDISCDINGSLACTVRDTDPGNPIYVYDPKTGHATDGIDGPGLAVMAVGNLPSELPKESSIAFSKALSPFIPELAELDLRTSFDKAKLSDPIKRSVVLWRGEFTPSYEYMNDFIK